MDRCEERWSLERKQSVEGRMGPRMDNGWGDGLNEKVGLRKRWGLGRIRQFLREEMGSKRRHCGTRKKCCHGLKGCMGEIEERMRSRKGHTLGEKNGSRMSMGK